MPWIEKEGRTVEEAQEAAVAASGLPVEELDVEVLNEGAKGLFGLGGEPAIVRARPKSEAQDVREAFNSGFGEPRTPTAMQTHETDDDDAYDEDEVADAPPVRAEASAPPAPRQQEPAAEMSEEERLSLTERQEGAAAVAVEIVQGVLTRLGLDGEVQTRVAGGTVYVEVFGEEMGILIGRGGGTLEALQELVRAGVQRRVKARQAVVVDIEAYWERRRSGPRKRSGEGNRDDGGRGNRGGRDRGRSRGNQPTDV